MTNEEKILEMLYALQKGQEELKAGQQKMEKEIAELKAGQERMEADIADIKEDQGELRLSINIILDWTDKVSEAVNFPLPRV